MHTGFIAHKAKVLQIKKATKFAMQLIKLCALVVKLIFSLLYNIVVGDSSLITGGHAISKVRLMDEENEVNNFGLYVIGTVMVYLPVQAENVLGVSESDMINYHSVFADSGNSGAQVWNVKLLHSYYAQP